MSTRRHRPVWQRPTTWFVGAALARHAFGALRLKQTLATIDQRAPAPTGPPATAAVKVHIVVPLLREQPHVAAAIDWFTDLLHELPCITVTLVTTARDDAERHLLTRQLAAGGAAPITARRFPPLNDAQVGELEAARTKSSNGVLTVEQAAQILDPYPTTTQVVDAELVSRDLGHLPIRHVRYDGDGRKAAQVNHAVELIENSHGDQGYVAVYDVDSRPNRILLERTLAFIEHRWSPDGELPPVVQQSARFTTRSTSHRAWERAACRGAARMQTLWTLRREIPDFRRYARATTAPTGRPIRDAVARGLAQTVGHGLWVRLDVFRRLDGLPTFTLLDDLPFGYRLTIEQVPVHVLPYTATADAPEDVSELIAQGRRWFHNYLDYPRCTAAAAARGHGTAAARAIALVVGSYRGATWLLRSPALMLCAAAATHRKTALPVRCAGAAAVWLAVVTPVRLLNAAEARPASARQRGRECLELTAGYLLSSIGPAQAVAGAIFRGPRHDRLRVKTSRRAAAHLPSREGQP